jgi:DNA-binding response OmpR family regulator
MTSAIVRPLVLIVDDDQDTREMYTLFLQFSGMGVLTASTVADGFALALEHRPDVVITDFMLNGPETGADMCRRLRENDRTRDIPALLLTGSSSTADGEAALVAGCADVRIKPYLPDDLVKDIRQILDRPHARRLAG